MWFNEEACSAGLDALGWYHEKRDEARGIGLGPEHDWASHGCLRADVYRTQAASIRLSRPDQVPEADICVTADEIKTAFRFIAMGRPNHPEVVALAEYLAAPSEPLPVIVPEMLPSPKTSPSAGARRPVNGKRWTTKPFNLLQGEEAQAGDYVWGELAESREQAMRGIPAPYGDEEEAVRRSSRLTFSTRLNGCALRCSKSLSVVMRLCWPTGPEDGRR